MIFTSFPYASLLWPETVWRSLLHPPCDNRGRRPHVFRSEREAHPEVRGWWQVRDGADYISFLRFLIWSSWHRHPSNRVGKLVSMHIVPVLAGIIRLPSHVEYATIGIQTDNLRVLWSRTYRHPFQRRYRSCGGPRRRVMRAAWLGAAY